MIARLRTRIARSEGEAGFTLIELLSVIVIIGILLLVAVPSYLSFRTRAAQATAKANVRDALTVIETYYQDNNTYVGVNLAALQAIDAGVSPTLGFGTMTASAYCISSTNSGQTFHLTGPGGTYVSGACP